MMNPLNRKDCPRSLHCHGFSLTELLMVMGVITILASLSTLTLSSMQTQREMHSAVNVLANHALQARQLALSTGDPIAYLLTTDSKNTTSIMLLQGKRTPNLTLNWQPIAQASTPLTQNVTPNSTQGSWSTFYQLGAQDTSKMDLNINTSRQQIKEGHFIIFRPDGSIDSPSSSPLLSLSHENSKNGANYCLLFLQDTSGRTRIMWK